VKIKICGVRTMEGAAACAENQVDYVGFNFVTGRTRAITAEKAKQLSSHCGKAKRVGVFYDQDLDDVFDILGQVNLDFVQLHASESPAYCAQIAEKRPVIKAFSITAEFDWRRLKEYEASVQYYLFDAASTGQGRTFDWRHIRDEVQTRPYFLAGGLTSDNVGSAILKNQAYAVDTASGIEVDGKQSARRIYAFCQAVRSAAEGNQ
jgi:phosphoribosylanthranilate isomerase